ncbi:ATP-binding protein [Magnetospira thiophila]
MITALATVLAYAWLEFETFNSIAYLHEDSLRSVARTLAKALQPGADPEHPFLVLPESLTVQDSSVAPEYHYAIRRMDGTVLYENGLPLGPLPQTLGEDEDGTLYEHDPDGIGPEDYVGIVLARVIQGTPYWIQVEQSSDTHMALVQAIAEDFFDDGGWAILPFLLALLIGSILTIRNTLTPLDRLSHMAATIGPDTPDVHLPEGQIPSEVLPLVQAFNMAIDRMQDGYRLQREFTADAAHELRTPLAVLRAQVDLMPSQEQAAPLRASVDTMARLVSQLLTAARMDILSVSSTEQADLHAVAVEVAQFLGPLAIKQGREIEVIGNTEPMLVRGNAEALFDALRNLAENALTHSPPKGMVSLRIGPHEVAVIDHGPGIAEIHRPHLFSRFWRADRNKSGAGLGLSIVARIAEAHGAAILLEDTPGGGATFYLKFPEKLDPVAK